MAEVIIIPPDSIAIRKPLTGPQTAYGHLVNNGEPVHIDFSTHFQYFVDFHASEMVSVLQTYCDWYDVNRYSSFVLTSHSRSKFWSMRELLRALEDERFTGTIIIQKSPMLGDDYMLYFSDSRTQHEVSTYIMDTKREHEFQIRGDNDVKTEVAAWIAENVKKQVHTLDNTYNKILTVYIRDDIEATYFKLKWSDYLVIPQ
jgi:hypothetical protein